MQSQVSTQTIITSTLDHTHALIAFQCQMAFQTEKLKLNPQTIASAIQYMCQNPQIGFYLVGINPNNEQLSLLPIISEMCITSENRKSWWIQSVYVESKSRKKGNFRKLMLKCIDLAKDKGVKQIKLYAEKDNKRAKITYQKLGMKMTGEKFYGFELIDSDNKLNLQIEQPQNRFNIEIHHENSPYQNLQSILSEKTDLIKVIANSSSQENRWMQCKQGDKMVAYCQFFYQYSEWRFGLIIYINVLEIDKNYIQEQGQNICKMFIKPIIKETEGLKITTVRFLFKNDENKCLEILVKGGKIQNYDVMAIEL